MSPYLFILRTKDVQNPRPLQSRVNCIEDIRRRFPIMTSGNTARFSHHRPALPALEAGESLKQHDLMLLGKPYLASDPFLSRYRDLAADQFAAVSAERSMDRRMEILNRVCDMRGGPGQEKVFIAAPFTFEYVSLC